ncbi:Ribonucleases P/MRP protein subunit POP3 [Candida viswanathii]|uniref:Ribonucleases P/MRP protein subunit POP3 n=1 Tax=Candida viswanathii TaxID=5486 RepID=A0A367YF97_9ASCO|nr:Ribonucleases P/MRP protein subunit POP3 [Candida viswanathii]
MSKPNKVTKLAVIKSSAKATSSSIKAHEAKKRLVFRPILENPYTQSNVWPFIQPELGSDIVALLESLLKNPSPEVYRGFNQTVAALEKQAAYNRGKLSDPVPQIKYVFVCKFDISPAILTSMFPVLSVTASRSADDMVKLVQLPRGSIEKLGDGIIGLTPNLERAKSLYDLVDEKVKDVDVPWLNGIFDKEVPFEVPKVKQIQTSVGAKK